MNENEQLYHHGILGMKWGIRRYQNPDGSYKPGAEGRYASDGKSSGRTIKNRVKSALGIYKEGDGNPYVSEKRREDRRRQEEEQKKQQAAENDKKAKKDVEKGQWYKTYNDATDKFNPLLSELNKRFGDEADIDNPKYMKAVGDLWNKTYSDEINRKYGSGVTSETIENFPLYNMYLAEIRTR